MRRDTRQLMRRPRSHKLLRWCVWLRARRQGWALVNSAVSQLLAQGGRGWTQGAGVLTNKIGIHERCGGLCTTSESTAVGNRTTARALHS